MRCINKFWLENFKNLFCSFNLVPIIGESLEEQMNSLTRLVFVIFFMLLLLDYKFDLLFLFLSNIIIIIIYYLQRTKMIENYVNLTQAQKAQNSRNLQSIVHATKSNNYRKASHNSDISKYNANVILYNTPLENALATSTTPIVATPQNNFWCNKEISLSQHFNDPNYISSNQKLANGDKFTGDGVIKQPTANPKTLKAPIIVPPIADFEHWKPNDFIVVAGVNDQKTKELAQSGYLLSNCCETPKYLELEPPIATKLCECDNDIIENYSNLETKHENEVLFDKAIKMGEKYKEYEKFFPYKTEGQCLDCCDGNDGNCPCTKNCKKNKYEIAPTFPGQILTSMGYNPDQLELHNIPSNLAVGKCNKDDKYNCLNKNLFTSIIQPGVYARSEIIEPIQSNIGISFDQQFEPITCEKDCNGGVTFVSHDPKLVPKNIDIIHEEPDVVDVSNVYDPRYHGYGTSYRSYHEPVTGQTRFYYDDVEAIKKYNYITRNNIDFTDYGTSAGPMTKKEFSTKDLRARAQNTFTNASIDHRTDLQERLMRKYNANAWQQKEYPIITNVQTRGYSGPAQGGANAGRYSMGNPGATLGGFTAAQVSTAPPVGARVAAAQNLYVPSGTTGSAVRPG